MLSDHELKTLRELERRLRDEDPDFPRWFHARAQRLGRPHLGLSAAIAVVMVLGAVLVVAGAPAPRWVWSR